MVLQEVAKEDAEKSLKEMERATEVLAVAVEEQNALLLEVCINVNDPYLCLGHVTLGTSTDKTTGSLPTYESYYETVLANICLLTSIHIYEARFPCLWLILELQRCDSRPAHPACMRQAGTDMFLLSGMSPQLDLNATITSCSTFGKELSVIPVSRFCPSSNSSWQIRLSSPHLRWLEVVEPWRTGTRRVMIRKSCQMRIRTIRPGKPMIRFWRLRRKVSWQRSGNCGTSTVLPSCKTSYASTTFPSPLWRRRWRPKFSPKAVRRILFVKPCWRLCTCKLLRSSNVVWLVFLWKVSWHRSGNCGTSTVLPSCKTSHIFPASQGLYYTWFPCCSTPKVSFFFIRQYYPIAPLAHKVETEARSPAPFL
jgi:hypothetical protein